MHSSTSTMCLNTYKYYLSTSFVDKLDLFNHFHIYQSVKFLHVLSVLPYRIWQYIEAQVNGIHVNIRFCFPFGFKQSLVNQEVVRICSYLRWSY